MVDDRQRQRGERRPRPAGAWSGPGRARPAQPQNPDGHRTPDAGPPIPPGVEARQLAPEIR
ncbi:MAG: tetratricopeptide repeat protein, partial [Mycobacterium sp.]